MSKPPDPLERPGEGRVLRIVHDDRLTTGMQHWRVVRSDYEDDIVQEEV